MLVILCLALLAVFPLLYKPFGRVISSAPRVSIIICAPLHEFIVLLCFMLWALLLTSEVVFFFSLNSWFSVRGAWVGAGCGGWDLWLGCG